MSALPPKADMFSVQIDVRLQTCVWRKRTLLRAVLVLAPRARKLMDGGPTRGKRRFEDGPETPINPDFSAHLWVDATVSEQISEKKRGQPSQTEVRFSPVRNRGLRGRIYSEESG